MLVEESGVMEVHFIDVGQGDSTLITCEGHSMLIDTGEATKGTAIQNYLQKQKINKLDYLILTHPDSDHIGGAPVIITKFNIDKVFVSNYEKDNKTYMKLIQALDNKHLKHTRQGIMAAGQPLQRNFLRQSVLRVQSLAAVKIILTDTRTHRHSTHFV